MASREPTRDETIRAYVARVEALTEEREEAIDEAELEAIALEVGITREELDAAGREAAEGLERAEELIVQDLVDDAIEELGKWRALTPFDLEHNLALANAHARRFELRGSAEDQSSAQRLAHKCSDIDGEDGRAIAVLARIERAAGRRRTRRIALTFGVLGVTAGVAAWIAASDAHDTPVSGNPSAAPPTRTAPTAPPVVRADSVDPPRKPENAVDARPRCESAESCGGASCDGGRCLPAVLAAGQGDPDKLAVDGEHLYWANRSAGTIVKTPIEGGMVIELASGFGGPIDMAVDATHAYWVGEEVRRVPKSGGKVEKLGGIGGYTNGVAVDEEAVFVFTYGVLKRIPLDGGKVIDLATGQRSTKDLVLTADAVVWTAWNEIVKVPKKGGSPVTKLAYREKFPFSVVVDQTHAYWGDGYAYNIRRVPLGGGEPETLAQMEHGHSPTSVAIDDQHIYWVDGEDGVVLRTQKAPASEAVVEAVALGQPRPHEITLSDRYVFWSNLGDGTVMRLTK